MCSFNEINFKEEVNERFPVLLFVNLRLFVCLCVGAFEDEDIIHVEGSVDPVRDMEIIHEELRLKDEEMIAPILDKLEKTAVRGSDKKLKPEYVRKLHMAASNTDFKHYLRIPVF